jgi:4-diphosphocytidyl-2-C-methyl-D-erythritol kinase
MYLRRDQQTRIVRAPAKLNLFLEILGRRADGFHELATLMVPIRLSDSLAFSSTTPANDQSRAPITLEVHESYPSRTFSRPSPVPTGSDNLVVQALELLQERSGCQMGAHVELVKRIPAGAGLGGGSSDAAAVLRLANSAWRLDWPLARLSDVAAEVGSDVPFFLDGGAAICRGRGEQVEKLPGVRPLHFVIVKPDVSLSTADVYRAHDTLAGLDASQLASSSREFLSSLRENRMQPGRWMQNRLQSAAALLSPWIERLRTAFDRLGFVAHQLSGSGSAYFGVCRHARQARRLATILKTQQLGLVFVTRSCA